MFGFLRRRRRNRLMERPTPPEWEGYLREHVAFFADLDDGERARFMDMLKAFVWEKHFFGAGGLEITDEIRVVIGAAAVRLVFHLDLSFYDRLTEIVVYPHHYRHPDRTGVVFGEAHDWGTVVLSWPAVQAGLSNPEDAHDTATHEFAHVLDRADGSFDGTPELHRWRDFKPWVRVMTRHFLRLQRQVGRRRTLLRAYGAQNEAEFFAVATETFFEKPEQMKRESPDLYAELKRFYRWDPAKE